MNKNLLIALCLSLCLSKIARAEDSATPSDAGVSETQTSTEGWEGNPSIALQLGAGLASFNSSTGWALNTGVERRISQNAALYAGVELGFNFWNFESTSSASAGEATGVALLPTLTYGLNWASTARFLPYIGIAFGPQLYMEERTNPDGTTASDTNVYLQFMVRPGARFPIAQSFSLNIEPKFGVLGGDFIFSPTASAVVAL